MVVELTLSDAHQSGRMSDLLDDSIVTEVLQGEPERQGSQLRHRLAGGQTCCQRLSQKKQQSGINRNTLAIKSQIEHNTGILRGNVEQAENQLALSDREDKQKHFLLCVESIL